MNTAYAIAVVFYQLKLNKYKLPDAGESFLPHIFKLLQANSVNRA